MLTPFEKAFEFTIHHEGRRFVNDPDDPGGATKFGISLRFLQGLHVGDDVKEPTIEDVKNLELREAKELYRQHFWNPLYDELPISLAVKLFDLGVNRGSNSTKTLQKVINTINGLFARSLKVDGIYGKNTHNSLKHAIACSCYNLEGVYNPFIYETAYEYYRLAERRQRSRKYLFGWLRRLYTVYKDKPNEFNKTGG